MKREKQIERPSEFVYYLSNRK